MWRWTPEEDELLRKLALSEASMATIADRIKRSKSAIRDRAIKLNIAVIRVRYLGLQARGDDETGARQTTVARKRSSAA